MEAWTPKKLEQAWRIFDKAVVVIAEGIHVPTDELRAYLLEGAVPPMERERQQSDKLSKRIYDCHIAHPNWNARQVAMYLDASYDTVRGLGSREGIVWPKASIDAALLNAGANDRFALQDELGHYLHMSCERVTADKTYRWVGTAKQLLVARERYATAAPLRAVKLQQ